MFTQQDFAFFQNLLTFPICIHLTIKIDLLPEALLVVKIRGDIDNVPLISL